MGISFTGGIKIPEGSGGIEAIIIPRPSGFRYWRLETQGSGSNGTGNSISELKLTFDNTLNFLNSFTLTNLGGDFEAPSRALDKVNDGIAETSNAQNFAHVPISGGNFDFYVDFGEGNSKDVTTYDIAPQGTRDSVTFHNILAFNVYRSSDASNWTLVKAFSEISTGIGPWNPGDYRQFDLTT